VGRRLVKIMGGPRPASEFTFERFRVASENRLAFERARTFAPRQENLYFWGSCGVGKTHLAYAIGRTAVEEDRPVKILKAPEITRSLRMRDPEHEQRALEELARVEVFILDDLGMGTDTPFFRQILQEVLDRRHYRGHGGLVITAKYSLDQLAAKLGEDSIPSRLAGMCTVVLVGGTDHRLAQSGRRPSSR